MQAQEILRSLRLPELQEFSQFFRSLPAPTLVGIGALAAVIAYWLATRPKAMKPPCDLTRQSKEVEVSCCCCGASLQNSGADFHLPLGLA